MVDFPAFMKNRSNRISSGQQNTDDAEGYWYEGNGGGQMAFWTCHADRESKPHQHPFDEYMVCVQGRYTAVIEGKEIVLNPGDELFIPKGTVQSGRCIAGTRTIHAFGGTRIKKDTPRD
jgi:quercetin dioxygenase-like cupin family protein